MTQQSSDTTYGVYDYNRVDANGEKRELYLDKAIEVSTVPHEGVNLKFEQTILNGTVITKFVEDTYFSVYKWDIEQETTLYQDKCFQLVSVINGQGTITTADGKMEICKGDYFILPSGIDNFIIDGKVTCIVSHPQLSPVQQQLNENEEDLIEAM